MQFEENVRKLEENWVPSRGESHTGISHSPRNLGENHWKIHFGTLRNAEKKTQKPTGKKPEKKIRRGSVALESQTIGTRNNITGNYFKMLIRRRFVALTPEVRPGPKRFCQSMNESISMDGWMDGRMHKHRDR